MKTTFIETLAIDAYLSVRGRGKVLHNGYDLVVGTSLPNQEVAYSRCEEGIGTTVGIAEVSLSVHELEKRSVGGTAFDQPLLQLLRSVGPDWSLGGRSTALSTPPLGDTPPATEVTHLHVSQPSRRGH